MEPAAPGTEDVPISFPTVSKQESEQERLLSLRAYLPNGQYGNVFECSYTSGAEHWYCNMCECPIMGRVYHHEIGKRHTSNMSMVMDGGRNRQQQQQQQTTTVHQESPAVRVAPGEPVPPGFEGEVEKVCEIQGRLDNYTVGPLVGLEYVFELQEYDPEKEPTYLCMLCDKKGDPRTVIAHLASYNHIAQYLQKHFPTAYRTLSPYATKVYKRNWQTTLQKIAEAVENRFGRLKPHPVELETFEQNRLIYLDKVHKGPHYSEMNGCTFEEIVDKNELTRSYEETTINKPPEDRTNYRNKNIATSTKRRSPSPPVVAKPTKKAKNSNSYTSSTSNERRRSLSSVSSISSSDLSDFEPQKHPSNSSRRHRSITPRRSSSSRYRRSPSPRSSRRRSRSRDRLPWQRSDYRRPRTDFVIDNRMKNKAKSEKMDEYKKLAAAIENDMSKQLKQHEKNPEKHPQYNDEWKQFWNRRYKELQAEGKDPNKYDFKPEWIVFWNKRMLELHNNEVKAKKEALRRRLGLPEEPAPICFRITGKKKLNETGASYNIDNNKPTKPMAASPDADPEIIVIDDKEDDSMSSCGGPTSNKRTHSPWDSDSISRRSRSRSIRRDRSKERMREKSRTRERSRERARESRGRSRDSRERGRRSSRDSRERTRERSRERTRERSRGRSRERDRYSRGVSWDRDIKYYDSYRREREIPDAYKPPRIMRDVTRQPVLSPPRYTPTLPEPDPEEEEGDINVVSVLRLLTALEEKLGSLGPKIIDLLAQALAMEKNEANSSETILDNEINCVLFETVKEKLKGQLLAGLVEYTQEKAYKNAIKKIASLIHYAGQRKKERETAQLKKPDPVKVPGIGTVDKAAIAKQIANALILQGKTDVTQAELEQLINAVVGMAEASKSSNKPITTASFVQQLQQQQPSPVPEQTIETKPMTNALQQTIQSENTTNSMEGLSDSDLQTLLQNFKDLSTTEQHDLITYLKKLESKEPERVERLRKFVTLGQENEKKETTGGRLSPFSNRLNDGNPMVEQQQQQQKENVQYEDYEVIDDQRETKEPEKVTIDSDEEDYSFEDVFKAAKKNVTEKEEEKERLKEETKKPTDVDLKDAKAIIASLMSSVTVNKASVATASTTINMDNLTNIVGNLKNLIEPTQSVSTPLQTHSYVQYPQLSNPTTSYPNYSGGYQPRQNVQYPLPTTNNTVPMMPPYGGGFNNQIRGPTPPNPTYNPNNYRW